MEWLRTNLVLGQTTYGEIELKFPVINGGNMFGQNGAMPVIHCVEAEMPIELDAVGDYCKLHFSTKTQAAIINFNSSDCIDKFFWSNSVAGVSDGDRICRSNPYPKTIYPYSSIFVGGYAAQVVTVPVRIGYTMRNVNQNELMRSLIPR
jgi:hypothetical protein